MTVVRRVCWALARECRADDVVVVGVATPLAAAAAFVAREVLAPGLTIVLAGAVDPPTLDVAETIIDPCSPSRTAPATLGQLALLSLLQRGAFTLQFVSPAQVDPNGAVNISRVRSGDGWRRLPGCLALPDTTALVGRLVAYRVEGSDRFLVDRVDHVTGIGRSPDVRSERGLEGRGVIAVITGDGRREIVSGGTWSRPTPLEEVPAEVDDLLDRVIDPHGVLGVETRSVRSAAQAVLSQLAAARS